jgi:hypothetical protein
MNLAMGGVLSLGDLGFSQEQAQGDATAQARLDKRSHMLKIHQRLGLIATVPIVAAVIAGTGAGGRSTSSTDRYVHLALGSAAGDLYFMSAYYAIRAPRIPGTEAKGQIRLHKALAWIHGPGMVLTPILGAMAFDEKSKGERVHGIASAHGAVAIVTAAAYGAAILSVSVKFWELFGEDVLNRIRIRTLAAFLFFAGAVFAGLPTIAQTGIPQADSQWVLEQSTLTYHIAHPLHQVDGVSHAARGKGVCRAGQCDFLIAVPVKSFDSGDSNRDLHMLQVTRGGQFPLVTLRTRVPEDASGSTTIHADLEIQFAGQTAKYSQIPFQLTLHGDEAQIMGTIPTTLSDFKIDPPSLLALPVKNEMPVRVEMTWKQGK